MTAEQRAQTGACSAVLSGGWELEQNFILGGKVGVFSLVFFSYTIDMIEVEDRHNPK